MAIASLCLSGYYKGFLHQTRLNKTFARFCRLVLGSLSALSVKETLINSISLYNSSKRVLNIITEKSFCIGYVIQGFY